MCSLAFREMMMRIKTIGAMLAALALTAAGPVAAQSAAPLSLASMPAAAGADGGEASQLRGTGLWIAGAVVLALAIWGLTRILDDEDDFPVSP